MSNQAVNDEKEMTFGEHLDELRKILMRVMAIFAILFIAMFAVSNIWLQILMGPQNPEFPTYRFLAWVGELIGSDALAISPDNFQLINTRMAGQFMLDLKCAFIGSLIVALPYLLFELWLFVKPAIPPHMRRKCVRYTIETPIWFMSGLLFGYFVIVPLTINFLTHYSVDAPIANMITPDSMISTVMGVAMAGGLTFLLPMLIRLVATMGLVTAATMRSYRRHAAVGLLIFAAVITPPDVFSQVLIFFPCYLMYELGIRIASRIDAQRAASMASTATTKAVADDDDQVEDRETVKYD